MPIYEYRCTDCGKNFECLVFGQEAPENCPRCEGRNVQRLLSACGFVSKGSGGETLTKSAGASACTGCAATNCGSCGH